MVSGSYTLTKEEWVGVLNLSTRWQVNMVRRSPSYRPILPVTEHHDRISLYIGQLRDLAITTLSALSLTPVEKVTLARAHKVAKWLKEGLSEILVQEETLQPDELEAHLGLRTAFHLVWIRNQLSAKAAQVANGSILRITLGSLGCSQCGNAPILFLRYCKSCGHPIEKDDPLHPQIPVDSLVRSTCSSGGIEFYVALSDLRCKHCSKSPYPSLVSVACRLCNSHVSSQSLKLVFPSIAPSPPDTNAVMVKVEEVFKEELASYESWNQ
jgi:hypothetical protein